MANELKKRQEVSSSDKWNTAALYQDDAAWEADFEATRGFPERVAAYEGRLAESIEILTDALGLWLDANRHIEKVWVYAHLRADEDLGNSHYQSMMERARSASIALGTAGSYLSPEILAIEDVTMAAWMNTDLLRPYRVWLEDILRGKPHTLSPAEERLLAMASEPLSTIPRIFSVLKNVDLAARLPKVKDEQGEQQPLTHGSFIKLLESHDRAVRKAAFDGYYAEYRGNRSTNAALVDGAAKTHVFEARVRNFPSALEAGLFGDNISIDVYESLISAVHDALPAFYRYVDLRKRLLAVDKLHLYDAYVSVIPAVEIKFTYDEAVDLVCKALHPLGDDYVETAHQGLTNGWVDRYENVGKRSGAYSSGCYDSLPYILLNFTGTLDSVSTVAHELGHSMHSWHSKQAQPYHLADYRIFVAEVASTTNESLLHHYMLAHTDDRATRAYLIDRHLDRIRGTLFRQTMFAEFEKMIHERIEAGQPLTADSLDETYYGLVRQYFGDGIAFDEDDEAIAWEWSRIDHFFYNFYVYKYATGLSSALALASGILGEGKPALERYLDFLRSGSSKYPLDLLKDAGVNLATPAPVKAALAEFERGTAELAELMS
jgi:oligoendopeptidase F